MIFREIALGLFGDAVKKNSNFIKTLWFIYLSWQVAVASSRYGKLVRYRCLAVVTKPTKTLHSPPPIKSYSDLGNKNKISQYFLFSKRKPHGNFARKTILQ